MKNHVIKNSTWHRHFFASYIWHILQIFASQICHPLGQELKSYKGLKNDNPSGLVFIAPFLYIQHSEQRHLISGVGKWYMLNECTAHHIFNQSKLYKAYRCECWKLKLKTYKRNANITALHKETTNKWCSSCWNKRNPAAERTWRQILSTPNNDSKQT